MNLHYRCVAGCQLKTVSRLLETHGKDKLTQYKIVMDCVDYLGSLPPTTDAGLAFSDVFSLLKRESGICDPCGDVKRQNNAQALELLPFARNMVDESTEPMHSAIAVSCAGNLLDANFADTFDLLGELRSLIDTRFLIDDYSLLKEDLLRAERVMLDADNAGEIVLDRVLIDEIQRYRAANGLAPVKVTTLVKSHPQLNDAMREDALIAKLDQVGEIVDIGCDCIGTPISRLSERALAAVSEADVILAKGLANYESLHFEERYLKKVYFLFKAKCELIAGMLGIEPGSFVLMRGDNERNKNT